MIGIHDLYDLSAVFKRLRAEIQYERNIPILRAIQTVLSLQDTYISNQIRIALSNVPNMDKEKWSFAFHNNLYVYEAILKNQEIVDLLIKICDEIADLLIREKFDRAEDLADAVHCLPDIVAENKLTIPRSYWNGHLKPYRRKWDKGFLVREQRKITRAKLG